MDLTGVATSRTRLLRVTAGNLRQSHIYVKGHMDFFPPGLVHASRKNGESGEAIEIILDGLNETIRTDIGRDARNGGPRGFLRGRGWVRRFYEHHRVEPGALLALRRISDYKYHLSVETPGGSAAPHIRAAEFFAGIGLVRQALEAHNVDVVFANDIDPDKHEMYRDNFEAAHFRLGDIHELNPDDVPDCDLFTASFPCNDLSVAGSMKGIHCGQSSAFWGLLDLVHGMGERRPPVILLENVPGFLISHGGKDFEAALHALNLAGYSVDALFLNASNFVPQSRLRLFVIAVRDAESAYPFGLTPSLIRPRALVDFILSHNDVRWTISKPPDPPQMKPKLTNVLEDLTEDDPQWWSSERSEYFMAQLSEKHAIIARDMIARRRITYGTAFRRVRNGRSMAELRVDGIAGCLRTPRGGSGRQILFKAGKGRYQVRLLTPRECARLQGAPDAYRINVPLNQALFGFGDAVCVPVVSWIFQHCVLPRIVKGAGRSSALRGIHRGCP